MATSFKELYEKYGPKDGGEQPSAYTSKTTFQGLYQSVAQKKADYINKKIGAVVSDFENGTISVGDFKSKIEGYRSFIGDDTTNQIISDVDQHAIDLPKTLYKRVTSQYVPGSMYETDALLPENALPEIDKREAEYRAGSDEGITLSSYLRGYDSANSAVPLDPDEVQKEKDELVQYIKDTYHITGLDHPDSGIDYVEWARKRTDSLEKINYEHADKIQQLEHGMPLKKGYDAYNSLSDDDKLVFYQYLEAYRELMDKAYDSIPRDPDPEAWIKLLEESPSKGEEMDRVKQIASEMAQRGMLNDDLIYFSQWLTNYYNAEGYREYWSDFTRKHPIAANLANIPIKAVGGITGSVGAIGQVFSNAVSGENKPIDVNSSSQIMTGNANAIASTSREMIKESTPDWAEDFLISAYDIGTSTADSLFAAALNMIVPNSGLVMLGLEAASSAIYDASQRGASAGQALMVGGLAGISEALFEKFSLGKLIDTAKTAPKSFLSLIKSIGANMGVNFTEEAATEISNIISDTLIMQDLSNYNLAVEQYMKDEGLSREEAERKAKWGLAKQIGMAGLYGAIQGSFMGGIGNTVGYIRNANQARSAGNTVIMIPGGVNALLAEAAQHTDNATLQDAASKVRQKASASNVGDLAYLLQQQTGKTVDSIISDYNTVAAEASIQAGTPGVDIPLTSTASAQGEAVSGPAQQVSRILSNPSVTAAQADSIIKSPTLSAAFTQLTGKALDNLTNAEKRRTVQDAAGYVTPDTQHTEVTSVSTPSVLQEDGGAGSGLVYDDYVNRSLDTATANQIDRVAKLLGSRVRFVDSVRGGTANAQINGREILVEKNNPNPVRFLLGHEWTHLIQESAPEAYRDFRNAVSGGLQEEARTLLDLYRRKGEALSNEAALDEAAANMAGRMLEDGRLLDEFIERHRDNKSLLRRMWEAVKRLVHKLTGSERKMAQTAEAKLAAALDEAADAAANENAAQQGGGTRYSIDPHFASDIQEWDNQGRPAGETFVLGSTGDILQGLGAMESDIFMRGDKINQILKDHPEITLDEIKRIPEILEDPVLILKSKGTSRSGQNSRLVVFGSAKAQNGQPILTVLDLRPVEKNLVVDDMQKVTSAYTRNRPINFVSTSDVLYADKKRTIPLLRTMGLQTRPIELQRYGSIGSISYHGQNVNISGEPFSSVVNLGNNANSSSAQTDVQPDEKSNTKNSLKGSEDARSIADLERENRDLRQRMEHFKEQLHRSKGITTDKETTRREARQLIQDYGADLATDDIAEDLQSLNDFMASGRDGDNELSYDAARERSDAIARRIVENAVETDDSAYRQYADLREYLRNNKLVISPEDSRNIPDFNDFRKANFGRMNIGTRGETNIEQVYGELSTLYPEFFDEQRETTPAEQLQRIAEVAGEIYDTSPVNPFSQYMDEAITGVSNDIMERFFDLPQAAPTFADRKADQLKDLRRQNWKRTKEAVRKERARRERDINRLKARYRAKTSEARERQNAREMRARIIRHTNQLSKKLLRPSDKQHIPESLRASVASLLESLNLESAYSVDPETGKRVKDGSGTPTKRTEAARELRLAYAQILKDGTGDTMIIDPDLMDNLDEIAAMKDTPLMAMNTEQLQTVWATVKAVEASMQNANRVLGESRYKDISEIAEGIRDDNAGREDRGNYRGLVGEVDKLLNIDMLEPNSFFHRLGKTGEMIWNMLRRAQDRYIRRIAELDRASTKIIGETDIRALEKQTHTFDLRGQKLTLTTPQIMELLELSKRPQAKEHILVGGVRPEAVKTGIGIRESRPSEAVQLTPDDIARITGALTEEQVKLADALQDYLSNTVSEWGNETSMEVYGYRKFTDPHYYPIRVDRNQVQRDVSNEAQTATIAGKGFTKTTNPNANNAVMLQSIFDTFYSHAKDMASYSGWVTAMENLRRIRNFNFRDADGNRTGSVQAVIEKILGRDGPAYLDKLMDDINRGGGDPDVGFTERFASNYKAASVGTNLRVILQQPTSILRALKELAPKYLAVKPKLGTWDKVKKYAPIAQWKDWGFFDINTGRQMRDIILHTDSWLERLKQLSMRVAGGMDSLTWSWIWNAVEAEIQDTRPDITPGTDAFYQAVGERFSRIIDRTQVVDGVLQRSQIMRSKNWLNRTASSFMSEPTKTYNMMLNAAYDLRHAPTKEAKQRAFRALGRTSFALLASFVANSIMQSLVDALRDDDDEKNYGDKFLTALIGFSGDEETFMDYFGSFWSGNLEASMNPLEYIPYVKDALSLLKGYDVSRMDMEPIAKLITAGKNLFNGKYSTAGAVTNFIAEFSRLFGLSTANVIRDVKGIFNTITDATHTYVAQYYIDKFFLDLGYEGNASELKGLLEKAKENDMGDYEIIYADAWKNGYIGEQKVFDREVPDSITYKKQTYTLTPEQKKEYKEITSMSVDEYYSELADRLMYQNMDYEGKEKLANAVYAYLSNLAKDAVVDEYELSSSDKAMKMLEEAGVSAADQLLIKATADTDGNGSLTKAEYNAAVRESPLDEWAKQLLIQMNRAQSTQNKDARERNMQNVIDNYSR